VAGWSDGFEVGAAAEGQEAEGVTGVFAGGSNRVIKCSCDDEAVGATNVDWLICGGARAIDGFNSTTVVAAVAAVLTVVDCVRLWSLSSSSSSMSRSPRPSERRRGASDCGVESRATGCSSRTLLVVGWYEVCSSGGVPNGWLGSGCIVYGGKPYGAGGPTTGAGGARCCHGAAGAA